MSAWRRATKRRRAARVACGEHPVTNRQPVRLALERVEHVLVVGEPIGARVGVKPLAQAAQVLVTAAQSVVGEADRHDRLEESRVEHHVERPLVAGPRQVEALDPVRDERQVACRARSPGTRAGRRRPGLRVAVGPVLPVARSQVVRHLALAGGLPEHDGNGDAVLGGLHLGRAPGHQHHGLGVAVGASAAESEGALLPRRSRLMTGAEREDRLGDCRWLHATASVAVDDRQPLRGPRGRVGLPERDRHAVGLLLVVQSYRGDRGRPPRVSRTAPWRGRRTWPPRVARAHRPACS